MVVRRARQAVEELTRPQELQEIQVSPAACWHCCCHVHWPSVFPLVQAQMSSCLAWHQNMLWTPRCCGLGFRMYVGDDTRHDCSCLAGVMAAGSCMCAVVCCISAVVPLQEAGDKQETDRNYENMWRQLRNVVGYGQTVPFINLVCNHKSFAQTVENIFTLSFLVSTHRAGLGTYLYRSMSGRSAALTRSPHHIASSHLAV